MDLHLSGHSDGCRGFFVAGSFNGHVHLVSVETYAKKTTSTMRVHSSISSSSSSSSRSLKGLSCDGDSKLLGDSMMPLVYSFDLTPIFEFKAASGLITHYLSGNKLRVRFLFGIH